MTKILSTLSIAILLFVSCEPNDKVEPPLLAGQIMGNGIVHTDVTPDAEIYGGQGVNNIYVGDTILDVNKDGIDDFKLAFFRSGFLNVNILDYYMIPYNYNAIVGKEVAFQSKNESHTLYTADTLSMNDIIDENQNWLNDTCYLHKSYSNKYVTQNNYSVGDWDYYSNKKNYVGIKLIVNNKPIYGWIAIQRSISITITEYAIKNEK